MKFVSVTDRNFEDIFEVSAKYEQWAYVKHHIFDMVNNYAAVVNEAYLPIPFLVYENHNLYEDGNPYKDGSLIAFIQINYDIEKATCALCKLIVQETEQNRGYGTRIVSEIIKWACTKFGQGTMTAVYNVANVAADNLFSKNGFDRKISGDEVVAATELRYYERELPESDFDEIPYASLEKLVNRLKALKKYPQNRIGEENGIHFRKVSMDDCRQIIEMQLHESQEEYVMPFVDSLAESYSDLFEEKITVTYALCNGESPVGLVEICYGKGGEFPGLKETPVYELFRILVDKKYQKEGYGTKAVRLFLDYVKQKPLGDADDIVVSVVEGNETALKLYQRFGFEVFGRDIYGHIAMKRKMETGKCSISYAP